MKQDSAKEEPSAVFLQACANAKGEFKIEPILQEVQCKKRLLLTGQSAYCYGPHPDAILWHLDGRLLKPLAGLKRPMSCLIRVNKVT